MHKVQGVGLEGPVLCAVVDLALHLLDRIKVNGHEMGFGLQLQVWRDPCRLDR